jgi:hypothetical protein
MAQESGTGSTRDPVGSSDPRPLFIFMAPRSGSTGESHIQERKRRGRARIAWRDDRPDWPLETAVPRGLPGNRPGHSCHCRSPEPRTQRPTPEQPREPTSSWAALDRYWGRGGVIVGAENFVIWAVLGHLRLILDFGELKPAARIPSGREPVPERGGGRRIRYRGFAAFRTMGEGRGSGIPERKTPS